jgi:hypothetical protein
MVAPGPAHDPIPDHAFPDDWHDLRLDLGDHGVRNLRARNVRVESGVLYARLDTGHDLDWLAHELVSWSVRPVAGR